MEILDYIDSSPTSFHAVKNLETILLSSGFESLDERNVWTLERGKSYFVKRNDSSLISFKIPKGNPYSFYITASHSDSPCFKLKENPLLKGNGAVRLNVERYGGLLLNPWFDRPLSLAGRVVLDTPDGLKTCLINIDRDLLMIPNLCIHFNRESNEGHKINVQNEMMPVITEDEDFSLESIWKECGISADQVLSYDLYTYNRDKGKVWGFNKEYIMSPRLDDLECVYTSFKAFLDSSNDSRILCHAVFDNEEVGSLSFQGAGSTFLKDTLNRIKCSLNFEEDEYLAFIARSFLISCDNAHGLHPSYASSSDPNNQPKLNKGIVLKFNGNMKYTSDSLSASLFKKICKDSNVPLQIFTNNSNVAGGSTLGNISNGEISIHSVDIGLPQWAMHSPNESAGLKDIEYMTDCLKTFYKGSYNI